MVVGATALVRFISKELWTYARGLHAYFLAPRGIGNINLVKYGPWAGTQKYYNIIPSKLLFSAFSAYMLNVIYNNTRKGNLLNLT